jgi:hypothetical protein
MTDFFTSSEGLTAGRGRLGPWVLDLGSDLALACSGGLRDLERQAASGDRRSVLLAGIEVPTRRGRIQDVSDRLSKSSRNHVEVAIVPMAEGKGKFENIQAAVDRARRSISEYDWLVIADDDISFGTRMFDRLIDISELAEFSISQPAHRFRSYSTYELTVRQPRSLARRTRFVEIGPLTAIHRRAFPHVFPFPQSRWGYGIDALWSRVAAESGLSLGVVDAATIRHLRPIARDYSMADACKEGEDLIRSAFPECRRSDLMVLREVVIPA